MNTTPAEIRTLTHGCPPKQNVTGVGVSRIDIPGVCAWAAQTIELNRAGRPDVAAPYVCVTSVHGIVTAMQEPDFRDILNAADVVTSDGMPVVWAMRSFGVTEQQRVYGPDLMLALCEQAARLRHRVFLYGASAETLFLLEQSLKRKFPALAIVGSFSPPFRPLTPEEDGEIVEKIRESRAEIVFVGLSTPKQERWMSQHVRTLPGVVMFGVGAAFDFHAGRLRQAPAWMRRSGLEWFFRLAVEPRRLWKRYVLTTPRFLPLWAMQRIGLVRYRDTFRM